MNTVVIDASIAVKWVVEEEVLGALAFSVVADKPGRRPVIIGCTAFFSMCMLITPFAHDLFQLTILRFIR
jgi:MFS transporter, AAHS family, 4-hydroxybenzoate transporter